MSLLWMGCTQRNGRARSVSQFMAMACVSDSICVCILCNLKRNRQIILCSLDLHLSICATVSCTVCYRQNCAKKRFHETRAKTNVCEWSGQQNERQIVCEKNNRTFFLSYVRLTPICQMHLWTHHASIVSMFDLFTISRMSSISYGCCSTIRNACDNALNMQKQTFSKAKNKEHRSIRPHDVAIELEIMGKRIWSMTYL